MATVTEFLFALMTTQAGIGQALLITGPVGTPLEPFTVADHLGDAVQRHLGAVRRGDHHDAPELLAGVALSLGPDQDLAGVGVVETQEQVGDGGLARVDVRDDPGGFVDATVEISSQFLADGVVFWEEDAQGRQVPIDVIDDGFALRREPRCRLVDATVGIGGPLSVSGATDSQDRMDQEDRVAERG